MEETSGNACYGAPLLFAIITKKDSAFGERDSSAAAENVMVTATDLGLGSVYVMGGAEKVNGDSDLLQRLGVPAGFVVSVIVAIGKAAEQPATDDRSNRYRVQIK